MRLHRLRELFGELHERLDPPAALEAPEMEAVTPQPMIVNDELLISPVEIEPSTPAEPEHPSSATSTVDTPASPPFVIPERIVGTLSNRVQLADSLFAAHETQMALDVYTAIDLEAEAKEDAARHWIVFQIAGCYRRLGDFSEAARQYRQLVTINEPVWIGDMARWWLNAMETRAALTQRNDALIDDIDQLQGELHANDGP